MHLFNVGCLYSLSASRVADPFMHSSVSKTFPGFFLESVELARKLNLVKNPKLAKPPQTHHPWGRPPRHCPRWRPISIAIDLGKNSICPRN